MSNDSAHRLRLWLEHPIAMMALTIGRVLHHDGLAEADGGSALMNWARERLGR